MVDLHELSHRVMPTFGHVLKSESIRVGLLGVSRTRSVHVLVLAGVLLLGSLLLGNVARTQGWMALLDERLFLLVLFVLVAGSAVAAANAYWNDGLVLSWLLVFGPVLGWLWMVFVQGPVFFDVAIVPIAWAMFAALVVGTLGYVLGRRLDTRGTPDVTSEWMLGTIVGRDLGRRGQWLAVSSALFVLAVGLMAATRPFLELPIEGVTLFELFYPTGVLVESTLVGAVVVLGWMGLAMLPAYQRAGLLVSWAIVFGPLFGAILTEFVLGGTSGGWPVLDVTLAFLAALIFTLVLGTGGFILGGALRRVVGATASRRPPNEMRS